MRERGPACRWRPEGSPWSMRRFCVGGITGSGSFPRSRRGVAGPCGSGRAHRYQPRRPHKAYVVA
ncbi:hypothetical protein TAL182_CH01332 [Rhizobium sp. TAL182]|nr:hypothetical protein TAL182_CH01332 [Rhizobium sp. TAL182]